MSVSTNTSLWLAVGVVLLFIATPVSAFGAGDIIDVSNIDKVNYRHGDIENTLLELIMAAGSNTKFGKLDVKRVYFGNWLRDYSQAIDVGGLKQLPAETIRILLWCLSFMTFGYATGEFEVTAERLGCYRPEEHIDNPKDYADNLDARQYDQRLRAPVNEALELKVDPENGLKTYIASENAGCDTSAGLVRKLFEKSIELGRKYKKDNDKKDLYEALRLLGTGLHCLEDFSAHSNYTELALRELGVDAFPHVGKATEMDVKGKKVFPIVTGTFGMTDFLHSVVGEMGDKVAQSEIEDMDSQLTSASENDEKNQTSVLKDILDKVPWDMLEGDKPDTAKADELKQAATAKAEEQKQNPVDPNAQIGGINIEEAKKTAQQTLKDMYPILQFHDEVMKSVTEVMSKVPGLDDLVENMSGALQIFIFSLLAPYVKPIIAQARVELKSSSEGVLKSSEKGQYEVFSNDQSTDPTHSMLSKDHFSNVLNPVAGQVACATVKFVVPHIVDSWSDEGKDVRQTIDDILQIFHHPSLRDENRAGQKAMFETVKAWWDGKDESEKQHLKEILSTEGVKDGKNHEGHSDEGTHGHSHGAPPKKKQQESEGGVPSAQEGASFISSIANLALKESGLGDKLGIKSGGEQRQQRDETPSHGGGSQSHGRTEQSSYGSASRKNDEEQTSSTQGRSSNQQSSYGSAGRNQDEEESSNKYGGSKQEPSYSSSSRNNNQSESTGYSQPSTKTSYGNSSRNNNDDEPSYGHSNQQSSRRTNDDESENTGYSRGSNQQSTRRNNDDESENTGYSRGSNQQSSRRNDDDESENTGYSRGSNQQTSRRNDDRSEDTSYGNRGSSGYSGNQQEDSSFGSARHGGGENETSSYGRSSNTQSSRRNNENESGNTSYGGGHGNSGYGQDKTEESEHGSRRRGGNDEETSRY